MLWPIIAAHPGLAVIPVTAQVYYGASVSGTGASGVTYQITDAGSGAVLDILIAGPGLSRHHALPQGVQAPGGILATRTAGAGTVTLYSSPI